MNKSLKELTQLYASSKVPASRLLDDGVALTAGQSTLEKLSAFFERRQ
jgi:hypothetical protein